ncbi:LysR family transcriptional regulator [Cupriavidus sp. AU9028]|uniref:LysR family transcriptional regulator n=1 Tax=Cupriavidus sp. AU9028 TaxID=2871157 RepID=UPI001C9625F1|nr:LysR family transcriptional regulator [Cupriavidus sp. AU9028]MBY4895946.1 LysR family transcriptional regulator [Cupriavidus sp. AU9028]
MDKLLALKMFVETVDARGFSAAARRLEIATSSVTRAMDGLEDALGAVLLNRSTRQVTVTEAGATYYEQARRILEAIEEADASVSDRGDADGAVGQLRVSVPVAFGRRCIAPHLGQLLDRHPKLEVEVTLTDDIVDLLGERIDLAIRIGSVAAYDHVVARPIGAFRRRVVAAPGYLERHGTPGHPLELGGHRCLRYSYGGRDQSWRFRLGDDTVSVPVRGALRSNNMEVLHDVARAGHGIALLPDWIADAGIAAGNLQPLFDNWSVEPGDTSAAIHALYLPNQRGSRRINAFLDFLATLPGPLQSIAATRA